MSSTTKKKYVEKEMIEDFSLPLENQSILKIVKPRGNNLHQVVNSSGEEFLTSMPPKFRKHIWVKRGDYVIGEPIQEGDKVKAEIVRILTKDHIKHFIAQKIWPKCFTEQVIQKEHFADKIESCSSSDEDSGHFIVCNPNKPSIPSESEDEISSTSEEELYSNDSDTDTDNDSDKNIDNMTHKEPSSDALESTNSKV